MVITQKMQDAVDYKKDNFFFGFSARCIRVALCGLCRDDHIPQKVRVERIWIAGRHGESDNVGRTVALKILAVQAGDLFIVYDDEADFTPFTSQGA